MLLPYVDRNLTLTGYAGADRARISQRVAEQLRLRYVNVDLQLETRLEMPVDRFRTRFGEARLKTLETELMSEVLLNRGALLQINGETLLRGDYIKQLGATGPVLCLTVTLGAALRRLHTAMGARYHDPGERALAIGQLRRDRAAQGKPGIEQLNITNLSQDEIVQAIITQWTWLLTQ
jgi:shikimate kinase